VCKLGEKVINQTPLLPRLLPLHASVTWLVQKLQILDHFFDLTFIHQHHQQQPTTTHIFLQSIVLSLATSGYLEYLVQIRSL
jgi:hypothetical protein